MKVIDAKVDWFKGYCNNPHLQVLVDKEPSQNDLVWQKKDDIYYVVQDGYVNHYRYKGPGQGFGGSVITIKMQDGSIVKLKGPFSTRASILNYLSVTQCVDVSLTDKPKDFKRGYTFISSCITLDLAVQAAHLAKVYLVINATKLDSWRNSDLGEDQNFIVQHGLTDRLILPFGSKIPNGYEYSFYPSLAKDKIVKEK